MRPTEGDWRASATLRTHGAKPEMNGIDIGSDNGANVGLAFYEEGEHTPAEVRANANLFAAAKVMHAALVEAHAFIGQLLDSTTPDGADLLANEGCGLESKLAAALDKAAPGY